MIRVMFLNYNLLNYRSWQESFWQYFSASACSRAVRTLSWVPIIPLPLSYYEINNVRQSDHERKINSFYLAGSVVCDERDFGAGTANDDFDRAAWRESFRTGCGLLAFALIFFLEGSRRKRSIFTNSYDAFYKEKGIFPFVFIPILSLKCTILQ